MKNHMAIWEPAISKFLVVGKQVVAQVVVSERSKNRLGLENLAATRQYQKVKQIPGQLPVLFV